MGGDAMDAAERFVAVQRCARQLAADA